MNLGLIGAWYTELLTQLPLVEDPKTAAFTLLATDSGKIINCSGTFAIQFPSVKALATNWATIIQNTSTGALTVTPFGTETVDAKSTYVMYSSEARLYYRGATEIKSIVLSGFDHAFTTVGANNFVKPPGYTTFEGEIWNGGNSGAKSSAGNQALGGGGGGCFPFRIAAALMASTEVITVGDGGAAVATASTAGNVGGISSIGTWLVMSMPANAYDGSSITPGLISGGNASTGFEHQTINPAPDAAAIGRILYGGSAPSSNASAGSGSTVYGGAAGGSVDAAGTIRAPGTSLQGGNGGAASAAGSGTAGTAPGGGGGPTQTGAASGAGARGEVRIRGKV